MQLSDYLTLYRMFSAGMSVYLSVVLARFGAVCRMGKNLTAQL